MAHMWMNLLDDFFLPTHRTFNQSPMGSLLDLPQRMTQEMIEPVVSSVSPPNNLSSFGAADVQAKENAYIIEIDVPTRKEDIDIFIKDGKLLTVRARRSHQREFRQDGQGRWSPIEGEQRGQLPSHTDSRATVDTEDSPSRKQQQEHHQQRESLKRQTGSGEQLQQQHQQKPTTSHIVRERYCGHFERRFRIPHDGDAKNLKTTFDNGVLTIIIPRTKDAARDVDEKQRYGERVQF